MNVIHDDIIDCISECQSVIPYLGSKMYWVTIWLATDKLLEKCLLKFGS